MCDAQTQLVIAEPMVTVAEPALLCIVCACSVPNHTPGGAAGSKRRAGSIRDGAEQLGQLQGPMQLRATSTTGVPWR